METSKSQFLSFLESIKTKENIPLIEAVEEAFKVLIESGDPFDAAEVSDNDHSEAVANAEHAAYKEDEGERDDTEVMFFHAPQDAWELVKRHNFPPGKLYIIHHKEDIDGEADKAIAFLPDGTNLREAKLLQSAIHSKYSEETFRSDDVGVAIVDVNHYKVV